MLKGSGAAAQGKVKRAPGETKWRLSPVVSYKEAYVLAEKHGLEVSDFEWVCVPCDHVSDYCFGHGRICPRCGAKASPRLKKEVYLRLFS